MWIMMETSLIFGIFSILHGSSQSTTAGMIATAAFFAPLTGIKFSRFLPLAVLARIPSVISSTLVGATVGDGKLWQSALIFAATGLVGLAGILINSRIQKKYGGQNNSKGNPNE